MRKLSPVVCFVVVALTLVAAIALPLAAPAAVPPSLHGAHGQRPRSGWITPLAGSAQVLYIANGANDTITLYDAATTKSDPPVIGVIIDGITSPIALAVDGAGNLYVANSAVGSLPADVEEYAAGSLHPAATYTADITTPSGIATDKTGNLYVANKTGPNLGGPSIVEFPPAATKPSVIRYDPNASAVYALTADARSDVFVGYSSYLCCPGSAVDEFFGKGMQPLALAITPLNEGSSPPLGLALDRTGNLITADGTQIAVYAPTAQAWPSVLPPTTIVNIQRPQSAIALNLANSRLYGLDVAQNLVVSYNYPALSYSNIYLQQIEAPTAIAVSPWSAPPAPAPEPPPPHLPKSPPHATLYIGSGINNLNGLVNEYDELGKVRKGFTISVGISEPSALAVDAQENLYVADRGSNSITTYPYDQLIPANTLTNGLTAPLDAAVSGDGTLAIALSGLSEIVVYPNGNTSSPVVLSATGAVSTALDSSDDVYYSDGESVYEFPLTGSGYGPAQMLFDGVLPPPLTESLVLDTSGDIIVPTAAYGALGVFTPGSAAPTFVIGRGILSEPLWFALNSTQQFIYVLDNKRGLVVFRYPTGTPVASLFQANTLLAGVALAPAASAGAPWSIRRHERKVAR